MSAIETVLHQPAAQVMGWALLHFIWQGTLVAVLTASALAALRNSAADVRYVVATIALSVMLTLPVVTAVQLGRSSAQTPQRPNATACQDVTGCAGAAAGEKTTPRVPIVARAEAAPPAPASPIVNLADVRVEPLLPALVLAWLCGVATLTLRLMSGWVWVQRMKSHGTGPVRDGWQIIATRLAKRLHIARRVRLLESTLVDVPTVIGWLKPVVLLPVSALAGLTPRQLEAILAHELAHIRRHDYLVNLLQTLVETLLFYHPAVWWLSRRIRAERENCCDDLAVTLCGDPYTYAQALADLEELRGTTARLAMAASGGSLVQRVRRLLGAPTHAGRAPGWLAASATVLLMLGIAAGAVGTDAFQSSQPAASTPAVAGAPQSPVEPAAPQDPAAAAAALEASAKALANEIKDAWNRVVHRAQRRNEAELRQRAQEITAAVAELQAAAERSATSEQIAALREQAAAMAAQAQTHAAALGDANTALAAMDAATTMAALPTLAGALPLMPEPGFAGVGQSHGTFSWSNNGEKLEVKYDGEIEFTDDDTDVKRLSPGGSLRIRDGLLFASHTVEFRADASGSITRRFWAGATEKPFDPEGRDWLAKTLPRFIRQTGIGAPARVARILKTKGAAGVLAEISLIEGSWGKRIYFTQLLNTAPLDLATTRQVLMQAGREIESDFELASLLIESADKLLLDDATRQAYFEAAKTIGSDFEMRRVFSSALKRGPVSGSVLAGILDASRNIDSDFEEASLLVQIAKLQLLDATTRAPFFSALGTVGSDFEHRRVLSAVAERPDLGPDTIAAMLASAATVGSDFEAASFLVQIAKQQPIEGALRAPFFRAVDSVDSTFERGRVLQAVVQRSDASADTILAVLRAAAGMNGSFEASQVLLAIAAAHPLTGTARDAYIDAAEKLGDFEQGKVLAALVRNERRK